MLLAAAASGGAPSGALALPRAGARAGACRARRRRRRGRRAGTAASVARGRAALALRSPGATRARGDPARFCAGAFRAPGRVQDDAEPSGDGMLRGASRFYTLSPLSVRARSTLGRVAPSRASKRRDRGGGVDDAAAPTAASPGGRRACARNATRRARTKTGEPPEGIEPPLRELESRVIPLDQSGCVKWRTPGGASRGTPPCETCARARARPSP